MSGRDYNLIIKKTAKELDIPEYEVWEVMRSVFVYISALMESGTYEGFYMRGLGKMFVSPVKIQGRKIRKEDKLLKQLKEKKDVRINRLQSEDQPSDAEHSRIQSDMGQGQD